MEPERERGGEEITEPPFQIFVHLSRVRRNGIKLKRFIVVFFLFVFARKINGKIAVKWRDLKRFK